MDFDFDAELKDAAARFPARDLNDLEAARTPRRSFDEGESSAVQVTDVSIPRAQGDPLRLRMFQPWRRSSNASSAIIQFHAGGFVLGTIAQDHARNLQIAEETGAAVIAVDYRLAPEHPFPAALDDAVTALDWVANSECFDPRRIALAGRSAGGGLAAALALHTRDHVGTPIAFQLLSQPQLDHRMSTSSMRRFTDTPMWTASAAALSWRHYLRALSPESVPPYASPSLASDLAGLPPAYVSAMEFDPLRDEAVDYARRLQEAGVRVELHVFPGTFHGSSSLIDAEISRRERAEEIAVLRAALLTPAH
ncbi:alpha/beta hydrolase [Agrococcus baldri]|uniref:Esterase n=1 Tax=Agrococcus baldri TaxID=153730 RepID=A0AA87UT90_9MICO|nr:alpha/beta hydrolase [Agrococcus baldri]GEK81673.1 esterase [Agrococcus baldri]